jgi:adenylate cyclase
MVELRTFDLRFLSRGIEKPSPEVVLAVMDEKSLDKEGRWPWPRSKIARLVDILSQEGAKVIGLDIGFFEPDENTNLRFLDEFGQKIEALKIRNNQLNQFLEESKTRADNDFALANAIRRSEAKVVLGYFFHMSRASLDYQIDQKETEDQLRRIENSMYPLVRYARQHMDRETFPRAYAPEGNLDILSEATDGSGFFNMDPDPDGGVRWMPLTIKYGTEIFMPLSMQSVWQYLGNPQLMVKVADYGVEGIQMGERFIPTDETGRMLIKYLGPTETFPHYSISDILHGKLPEGTFRDKIVLVGVTAIAIYDVRNTPFSPLFPGVEIHATVIDNILKQEFLNKPKWALMYDALVIVILAVLTGILLPRLSALKGVSFASGLFVLHILASRWLFTRFGLWVNIVYPLLALILIYTSLTIYRYMTEERERKKIKDAFTYYVSSSVVNEILKDPSRLRLGGDKRELSVLFSDIRGFTTISEGLSPEDLTNLLNEYLTVMTDVVFKYDGTLDKYMGDALMAIYGAPLEQPDHAYRACASAIEMLEELGKLNEKWIQEGKKPLDIGIGINTGTMMVGNMGSEQRFDYTVMGDAVNLGSRLEGANKAYQTNILISDETYKRVKNDFVCMELDSVRVEGKTHPVTIFQLVGRKDIPPDQKEAINQFQKGLQLYKQQKWDEAIEVFRSVSAAKGGIHAADLYIRRSMDLKSDPPPSDWDGVHRLAEK